MNTVHDYEYLLHHYGSADCITGRFLEGQKTRSKLRKSHGIGVYPLHELLNGEEQVECEAQLEIYM